jgi:hypothetical protein
MRFCILAMTIASLLVSRAEVSGQVRADDGPIGKIAVTNLIARSRLPISLSTKPDYSDVVFPDGTIRPRALSGR